PLAKSFPSDPGALSGCNGETSKAIEAAAPSATIDAASRPASGGTSPGSRASAVTPKAASGLPAGLSRRSQTTASTTAGTNETASVLRNARFPSSERLDEVVSRPDDRDRDAGRLEPEELRLRGRRRRHIDERRPPPRERSLH